MGVTGPTTMSERPPALTSDHGRNTSNNHVRKDLALISYHGRNTSNGHVRKALHLHLTMGGTHPTTMSERNAQHSHLTMGGTHPPPC